MKHNEFIQVSPVNRWHSEDGNWQIRQSVLVLDGIRLIESAMIVRQVEGLNVFPQPHPVLAIVGMDWSTIFIEPDTFARDFLLEWFELTQAIEPERLVTFLMDG